LGEERLGIGLGFFGQRLLHAVKAGKMLAKRMGRGKL
jgi:hypothetical protein